MSSTKYTLDPDLVKRYEAAVDYVQQPCNDKLGVVTWGTRGSKDVCAPNKMHYGGNTTCWELKSKFFHPELKFYIDAGGGMQPAGEAAGGYIGDILRGADHLVITGFTHYHWDHIVGLPFTGYPFIERTCIYIFGPKIGRIGPKETLEQGSLKKPFFPVPFQEIGHHFQFKNIKQPSTLVGLLHKDVLGIEWISKMTYHQKLDNPESTIDIPRVHFSPDYQKKTTVPVRECVKIFMNNAFHPDPTITYCFELPTGERFVFLTDHELQESVSQSLLQHIRGANCLIVDCQYKLDEYKNMYTGWGHGCDEYVVTLAKKANVELALLHHHDPRRTDSGVDSLTNNVAKGFPNTMAAGDYGIVVIN